MISFVAQDIIMVTGASSGIGAASALFLNKLGATVIGVGRSVEKLDAVRARCIEPKRFIPIVKDLAEDLESLGGWVKQIRELHGKFCGLFHAAGVFSISPVQYQKNESMERMFHTNYFAAYQLGRAFLDRRNNIGRSSSLVFVSSIGAWRDGAGISAYAATKGAILSMSKAMALEYASQGIRVNCISPDFIQTPMTEANMEDHKARTEVFPLGPGCPDDIAQAAAFLLSPASRWITGQNLIIDGGRSLL